MESSVSGLALGGLALGGLAVQVPRAAGLLPEGLEWHQGLGPRTASAASLSQGLASRTGSAISLSQGLEPKVSSACSLQHYAAAPAHPAATTAAALAQAQAPLAPALVRVEVGDASNPTEPQRRELLDRLVASLQLVQQGTAGAAAGAVCAGAGAGPCAGRASSPQLVLSTGTGKELSVSTLESTSPLDSVSRLDSVSSLLEQMSQLDLDESPTSPLSREESHVSLSSAAAQPVNHLGSHPHVLATSGQLGAATAATASLPHHLLAGLACPQQLGQRQGLHLNTAQVMARSQAMSQAPYPLGSHPFALLGHAGLQPAQMVQYLQQQQQLLMQQLLLQQHQAAAAAAEEEQQQECLVGPFGQYQGYCNQFISEDMNVLSHGVLSRLKTLQQADPAQGMSAKRYFFSIKEVSRVVHRAKCLIVAPDVKPNPAAHINPVKMLVQVLRDATLRGVPIVFALTRRGIGQVFGQGKSVSIVAVMSSDMCHHELTTLLQLAHQGRMQYMQLRQSLPHMM